VNPDPYTSADQKALDKLDYSSIEMQTVTLSMPKSNGSISTIELLRPTAWLETQGIAAIGKSTYLHLSEMDLEGFATVTDLAHFRVSKSNTASEEEWASGLVTGVFKHIANSVYQLKYSNGDSLGATATHPLYSLDRQQFIPTEDIKVGEHLLSKSGIITVVSKTYDPTPQEVYNLEVGQWHNFLVGVGGVVVHNGCFQPTKIKDVTKSGSPVSTKLSQAMDNAVDDIVAGNGVPRTVPNSDPPVQTIYQGHEAPKWAGSREYEVISGNNNLRILEQDIILTNGTTITRYGYSFDHYTSGIFPFKPNP
jgi:Pretoxin HINT domain